MNTSSSFKAISLGALVILGGYLLCMKLVYVLLLLGQPKAGSVLLAIIAAGLAMASGFVGAYFSPWAPVGHGVLAGFLGCALLLSLLAMVMPADAGMVFAAPLIQVTVLALVGALITVYVWPRHGAGGG